MVSPIDRESRSPTEALANTMRARREAVMPFGPARGRKIYEIRSAADLMAALQDPYVSRLSAIQLAAIEQALLLADWSDARERFEHNRRAHADALDRCRSIARTMLAARGAGR
jgi:hypothetical protein